MHSPRAPKASRDVLRVDGFKDADTVEKLLTDADLQQKIRGQVLLIDEAGLMSMPDTKGLMDLAKRQQARVILSGDPAQHSGVGRGETIALLQKYSGMKVAELSEVRRQTNRDYRAAVIAISKGDVSEGLERLDAIGAIHEVSPEDLAKKLAADYVAAVSERKKDGAHKTVLVVSPTHAQGDRVTAEIRQALKSAGRITGDEREFLSLKARGLTEAERGDALNYRPGDYVQFVQNARGYKRGERLTVKSAGPSGVIVERQDGRVEPLALQQANRFQVYEAREIALAKGDRVRITQNGFTAETGRGLLSKKSRLDNGSIYEVAGFTRQGDIRLSNGFVLPKTYGNLSHGLVVTSHASQGTTVDKVFIAMGSESLAAVNRKQAYVSVSRGKESVAIYTDDKESMLQAMQEDSSRLSATEMMEGQAPVARSSKIARLIHIQKIQRAYAEVRERMRQSIPPKREVRLGL